MLSLSNEVFKALVKYLNGDSSIDQFRDQMVGLRLEKYNLLAAADRLFLDEFEGRYAEFVDFSGDDSESLLKASLVSYVQSDATAIPPVAHFWSFPSEQPGGPLSINVGSSSPTKTFAVALAPVDVEYA